MERILKAEQAWPRRRITAEAWQAGREAEAVVSAARAEAAALRREAEAEAEGLRSRALEAGRAEGQAEAGAALAGQLLAAAAARDAALRGAEAEVIELALELARRILEREVAVAPAALEALAGAALRAARGRRAVGVRVHPSAARALRGSREALAALHGLPGLALVEDAALGPADAIVETEAGWFDGRLHVRLEGLRQALLGVAS